jgi:hypothetical protein
VRGRLLADGFEEVTVGYGIPGALRPQYLFSDGTGLARYLAGVVSLRAFDLPGPCRKAAETTLRALARTGVVGATAPAFFVRATWNGERGTRR